MTKYITYLFINIIFVFLFNNQVRAEVWRCEGYCRPKCSQDKFYNVKYEHYYQLQKFSSDAQRNCHKMGYRYALDGECSDTYNCSARCSNLSVESRYVFTQSSTYADTTNKFYTTCTYSEEPDIKYCNQLL